MSISDINKESLSNQIAEKIAKQITDGTLKPGEKLVEKNFAEEFGISRAPIRDALYLLILEGLVEKLPRKGAIVKEYSKTEIMDLLEIRNMLEDLAIQRIFEHGVDKEYLQKMGHIVDTMQYESDVSNYAQLNQLFHNYIIEMSKSEVIKSVYSRLSAPLLTIQSTSFSFKGNIEKSLEEHSLIVHYLKFDKLNEVQKLLNKHNNDVIYSIFS